MTSVGTVIGPHLDVVKDLPADVLAGIERIAVCCRDGVQKRSLLPQKMLKYLSASCPTTQAT